MCHAEGPPGLDVPDVPTTEIEIEVEDGTMPAMLASAGRSGPAVLVIADIYGRSPFYEGLAKRIAAAGCHAILPDYFFREGPLPERTMEAAVARRGTMDGARMVRDLDTAVAHLRDRDDVEGDLTGTIGFCMGGTLVLNLSAIRSDLAGVCYYGFPAGAGGRGGPVPLEQVGAISGPLLGFWGDEDAGVGMENVAALAAALAERKVDFEHHIYPGLGHAFMAHSGLDPEHPSYGAAADSWERTTAFLKQRLEG